MNRQVARKRKMKRLVLMLTGLSFLMFGTATGAEPVKVTPRLVGISPIKYKQTEREGFTLKIAFGTEDGRIPNTVSFVIYTALVGWELLHGDNSYTCQNAPQVAYRCTRPNSAVETLYFGRYDLVLTEADKRFYTPKPQPFNEFKEPLEDYFFLKVQYAFVWSKAEMAEEEFCEALSQHQWKHDTHFHSGIRNGLRFVDYQPDEPLVVLYWADLSEQEIKQGQDVVKRLAQQYGVSVATQKSNRLWSGGFVSEQAESIDLPERNFARKP